MNMVARLVGFISCMMCAIPFLIIATYSKDDNDPINFWSGDTSLKDKVKNVREYNKQMAILYKRYAISFLVAGCGWVIHPILGIALTCLVATLGIYLVYRNYKKTLNTYSK